MMNKVSNMMNMSGQLAEKGLKPFIGETFIVGGHKMPKIWILVADSKKAYFFRKPDQHVEKIGEAYPEKSVGPHIQGSGGGGRCRLSTKAKALNISKTFVLGISSLSLTTSSVCAGFDLLGGPAIQEKVDEPHAVQRFLYEDLLSALLNG